MTPQQPYLYAFEHNTITRSRENHTLRITAFLKYYIRSLNTKISLLLCSNHLIINGDETMKNEVPRKSLINDTWGEQHLQVYCDKLDYRWPNTYDKVLVKNIKNEVEL